MTCNHEGTCRCNVIPMQPMHPSVRARLMRMSLEKNVSIYYMRKGVEQAIALLAEHLKTADEQSREGMLMAIALLEFHRDQIVTDTPEDTTTR